MDKPGNSTVGMFFRELLSLNNYKRSQGRIARQVTAAALAIAMAIGAWRLSVYWGPASGPTYQYVIPGVILMLGLWVCFRVYNLPRFADFLIAVEAEMNKVSWPSRGELIRSSLVVMVTIFVLAFILFGFDLFWRMLLGWLGIGAGI